MGGNEDLLQSLQQTTDGGYILGGFSDSHISGDKSQPRYGNNSGYNHDYWVVKVTANGTKQWDRTYGGTAIEQLRVARQTTDGGYIFGGISTSGISGDKTQPNQGDNSGYDFDYWLLKVDASGTKKWDLTYGGPGADQLHGLEQTSDGGYIVGGTSSSGITPDRSQSNQGYGDFWILKLEPTSLPIVPVVQIKGDSLLCSGQTLTLTVVASPPPIAYRWNTGATAARIDVTQPGTYSVLTTFSGGLTHTTQHQVLPSSSNSFSKFTLGRDTTLCAAKACYCSCLPILPQT